MGGEGDEEVCFLLLGKRPAHRLETGSNCTATSPLPPPQLPVEVPSAYFCPEPGFGIHAHTCLPGLLALVPTGFPHLPGHKSRT